MSNSNNITLLTNTISDIVIDPLDKKAIRNCAATSSTDFTQFIDSYIRKILQQGTTRCNTIELAHLYAYTYVLMHIDAFHVAAKSSRITDIKFNTIYWDNYAETLIVDFGCGPGTVALALAEAYTPNTGQPVGLPINYLGLDIEDSMLCLAEQFFESTMFDCNLKIEKSDKCIRVNNMIEPQKIIFVFHYIFSQDGISESLCLFLSKIKSVIAENVTAKEYYLMYANINFSGAGNAFKTFINMLKRENIISQYTSTFINSYAYNFRRFNELDGNNIDRCSTTGSYVYTKVFKLTKPS